MAGTLLNYAEVVLSEDQMQLKALPGHQGVKEFRDQHGENFHFYFFDNQILYWPKKVGIQDDLGGKDYTIDKHQQPQAYSKVIEHAIVDLFYAQATATGAKAYRVFKNRHHHLWEFISNKNEVEQLLPGLGIYRKITMHPVYLKPNDTVVTGFTLAANLKFRFLWNAQEFVRHGIDVSHLSVKDDGTVVADLAGTYHYLAATGNKASYDRAVGDLDNNENTFGLLDRIIKWIYAKRADILLPGNVAITNVALRYLPFQNIQLSEIYSPARYFYNGVIGDKKKYYNQQVKESKPFSFGMFEDKVINIGVLFPAEYEGRTELFLKNLEGVLIQDLHLKKINYLPFKIPNTTLDAYKSGIYSNNDALKSVDVVIVIVNEGHEKLSTNLSPYYVCKAKLIGMGIPTQDIQIETIQNRVYPLVMSNISLNIYAKLGGTAWTIEKEEKLRDELVIGIGSTQSPDGTHILGIAQIFHPDGRYIVGSCSPLSTLENYAQNLEIYLHNTLKEVIDTHINTAKSFRLIFHIFKTASQEYELQAIERLIARFQNYTFDYALLHLGYGHNFRLYADNGKGKLKKGSYVQITPYMGLLHFVPESVLPLKIELDKRSKGFKDLFYLSKQVFWFSNLSHRSYNPSKRTVTIMYPSLMAALTEKLSHVDGWNHEMLHYVKDKQWFI
jgi:hypothetical protein